jgi:hemoglobin
MSEPTRAADEATIRAFVLRFYEISRADPELGPLFEAAIKDWDHHVQVVSDFWSTALLGTKRYVGTAYAPHVGLPIEEHHFARWLMALDRAGKDVLPPELAERAMARARHMMVSMKAGLLPFKKPDGSRSSKP